MDMVENDPELKACWEDCKKHGVSDFSLKYAAEFDHLRRWGEIARLITDSVGSIPAITFNKICRIQDDGVFVSIGKPHLYIGGMNATDVLNLKDMGPVIVDILCKIGYITDDRSPEKKKRECRACGKALREKWVACPYCGAEIE